MSLSDPVIRIVWIRMCEKVWEYTNLAHRARAGATVKSLPLDRLTLRRLLRKLKIEAKKFDRDKEIY